MNPKTSWILFISTGITLFLGFNANNIWIIGGLLGLIPAITWVINDLRAKTFGSDILAVLALVGTLLTDELFAASVIAFMLASGRILESWAQVRAEKQLKSLIERVPRVTNRVLITGKIEEVELNQIVIGDRLLVRSGEIVPTNGQLTQAATLDESALTGEPLPVNRAEAEIINSGIVNAGAPFEFIATTTSEQSTYSSIIRLVKTAHDKNSPSIRIANKWAIKFVPIALIMAGAAWLLTGEVERAVAVLVTATPCPLILAVPIAIVSGLSQSAKNGVIIKGGAILELLGRTEVVLLDKTGTLTHGGPVVSQIQSANGFSSDEILQLAASVDQYSTHIIAKTLVSTAKLKSIELLKINEVNEIAGHRIEGKYKDEIIKVGQLVGDKPNWLTLDFPLIVAIYKSNELIGAIGLQDEIRSESKKLISDLKAVGVKYVALVTGDK
ncbi:MAG: HAD family hydrolase, partial [Actinobacteria bacterium]|nr:HAD family hydrolase [Actinomycetota bacterium]